jgi:hypothetical protein
MSYDPEQEKRNLSAALVLALILVAIAMLLKLCESQSGTRHREPHIDTITTYVFDTVWKEIVITRPRVIQYVAAPKSDTGAHISYSDSLRYVRRCDSLAAGLVDCAARCLSQAVYGDTVMGDTVSVWYRATVTQNTLAAVRVGYRLEIPITERTVTVTEYEEVRTPTAALWLDGGIGYQQGYSGLPVGPVGNLGLSYRSRSGVAVGVDAGVGMGGWSVQLRIGKRLLSGR